MMRKIEEDNEDRKEALHTKNKKIEKHKILETMEELSDDEKEYSGEELEISEEELNRQRVLKRKAVVKDILSNSLFILIVLILTLLIVKYVGQRTVVNGQSMEPTLHNNDNLIVDKISYRFKDPERFDIIVFPPVYNEDTYYIKRIIGMPGETIRIDEQGNIYINGEILEENYGTETILDPGIAYEEILIGEEEYFVMGDNRNHSSDSRTVAVGMVPRKTIVGRAFLQIYPFSKFGLIKHE